MKAVNLSMERSFPKHFFLVMFLSLIYVNIGFSQGASFNLDQGIILQQTVDELPYVIEITLDQKFTSQKFHNYFTAYNTAITTVISKGNKLEVSIEKRMKPNWTLKEWNEYLLNIHLNALRNEK